MNKLVELFKQQSNIDLFNLPKSHKAFFYNFLNALPADLNKERFEDLKEIIKTVLSNQPELKKMSNTYSRNLAAYLCESTKIPGEMVKEIIKENKLNFSESVDSGMDKGDFQSYLLGRKSVSIKNAKRHIATKDIDFYISRLEIAYECGFKYKPKEKDIVDVMYGFSSIYVGNMNKLEDYLTILIDKGFVKDDGINKIFDKCTNERTYSIIIPLLEQKNILKFGLEEQTLKSFVNSKINSSSTKGALNIYGNIINSLNIEPENKKILKCLSALEYIKEVGRYIQKEDMLVYKEQSLSLINDSLKLNGEERNLVIKEIDSYLNSPNFIPRGEMHNFLTDMLISFPENQKKILLDSISLVEAENKNNKTSSKRL